jgi:hypothetical protein
MSDAPMSAEQRGHWWKQRGQNELHQILYWCWDPIGVNRGFPLNEDEYDWYAGPVFELVTAAASPAAIADYLGSIERDQITISTSADHRLAVAKRIIEWYPNSLDHWDMRR